MRNERHCTPRAISGGKGTKYRYTLIPKAVSKVAPRKLDAGMFAVENNRGRLAQLADDLWVYKKVRDVCPHIASKGQPSGIGKRN